MNELQTTLELINLDSSSDGSMDALEKELLADYQPSKAADRSRIASKQTNQQITNSPTDLDDRIVRMEFEELQSRIQKLVDNNVSFGFSGMMASAVAYKNLTSLEMTQLQINAIDISSFTNTVLDKLNDPLFLGFITISLVTDDLYQDCSHM